VVVREPEDVGGERPMMSFETITLVPIDLSLVDSALLTDTERGWLNIYHARVRDTIAPLVEEDVRAWLDNATHSI
jgi:Xaa-Pro aminopeptidase